MVSFTSFGMFIYELFSVAVVFCKGILHILYRCGRCTISTYVAEKKRLPTRSSGRGSHKLERDKPVTLDPSKQPQKRTINLHDR